MSGSGGIRVCESLKTLKTLKRYAWITIAGATGTPPYA
jgi:hypothetical protein